MLMQPSLTGTCVGLEALSVIRAHFGFPQHQASNWIGWFYAVCDWQFFFSFPSFLFLFPRVF
ncbi:hypothetical protein LX32DRAFT_126583 [Colletotrichum zoysiae]|uniref:Uncharacterized protein n=1 Tax=Colletotrichum zoysiae TaxID=1216348 RepID=A0AAD9H9E5_9PEZI|nr:hypothetical protein LX32DRAFT_126583 [Colletotrichum zoysiae]